MRTILYLCTLIFLAACQSPQKNYFLLTPLVPANEQEQTVSINKSLGLGPVELAEYLERNNMVHMGPNNKLILNTNNYWGEELEEGIVRVLSLNLSRQDPARMIQAFPWRSDRIPPLSLRIYINALVVEGGQAKINAVWELVKTSDKSVLERRRFIRSIETRDSGAGMAQSYSQFLADMAKDMNEALLKSSP